MVSSSKLAECRTLRRQAQFTRYVQEWRKQALDSIAAFKHGLAYDPAADPAADAAAVAMTV